MECPDAVKRLIERFNHQSDQVRSPDYNETQLRIDFINPLFAALGWDMDNASGYAEQYREVVHEDRVKIAGTTKAPDYSFRIGGIRKFFLEAKKPAVNIKQAWEPAYQLRRYAWSAKLAVSILTDFEELAIYDCRIAPKQMDKPATARREYISYTDYCDRWDFLYGTFSKEAVLKGDFDRYCASQKGRGAQEFDEAFLIEIEEWRKKLAANLALRNELTEHDLNFATQRIIDRVIFLRICEDRGVEPAGHLQQLLNGENTYKRLVSLFRDADARYNSGLFHFKRETGREEAPDELTLDLEVDDAALKTILKRLYYPESPYEFTVVSADILGSVYERFLGNIIERRGEHGIKVVEKPEVRKAGGVYYTPTYIVDYIVKQTVGKLLEGKTPNDAAKLKVLDPACGSGSFLLGAYQYLLDWHLKWYVADSPQKWSKGKTATIRPADRPSFTAGNAGSITPSSAGDASSAALTPEQTRELGHWALTIAERKRILLDNIHGVDIDYQAVEVTKLSLLLRCLEGETAESVRAFSTLFRERALPDLGRNIQCGNSLIGTDIMTSDAWKEMSEEERSRINPFDYERGFKQVFKQGGFDAVIGNPPYVRQESIKESKAYFQRIYNSFSSSADLFVYFMERGIRLMRQGGAYSIIVSSSVLRAAYGRPLRDYFQSNCCIEALVDFGGLAIFADAKDTYVCIPQASKRFPDGPIAISKVTELPQKGAREFVVSKSYSVPRDQFNSSAWSVDAPDEQALFLRLTKMGTKLGAFVGGKFFRGVLTGLNEAFVLDSEAAAKLQSERSAKPFIHRFVGGEDIRAYAIEQSDKWMIVIPAGWTRSSMKVASADPNRAWNYFAEALPAIARHLKRFEPDLRARQDKGDFWWELRPCDYYGYFDKPKIIFPDICKSPRFYLDKSGLYLTNTAYCLATSDKRILGFLNSRLFWFLISRISIPFGTRAGAFRYRLIYQYMEHVPINLGKGSPRGVEAKLIALVDSILPLRTSEMTAKSPQQKEQLRRRIDATDRQIDQLVYQLYGLSDDEIKLVEQSTQPAAD